MGLHLYGLGCQKFKNIAQNAESLAIFQRNYIIIPYICILHLETRKGYIYLSL